MIGTTAEDAARIHRILVFDGHHDNPVERVARGQTAFDWWRHDPEYHVDVPRLWGGNFLRLMPQTIGE